jgi:hypothetical protein
MVRIAITALAVPTIDLTDDEHAAVTAAIRRAIETDGFPRAPRLDPVRSALAKLDPATTPPPDRPAAKPPARPRWRPASGLERPFCAPYDHQGLSALIFAAFKPNILRGRF